MISCYGSHRKLTISNRCPKPYASRTAFLRFLITYSSHSPPCLRKMRIRFFQFLRPETLDYPHIILYFTSHVVNPACSTFKICPELLSLSLPSWPNHCHFLFESWQKLLLCLPLFSLTTDTV